MVYCPIRRSPRISSQASWQHSIMALRVRKFKHFLSANLRRTSPQRSEGLACPLQNDKDETLCTWAIQRRTQTSRIRYWWTQAGLDNLLCQIWTIYREPHSLLCGLLGADTWVVAARAETETRQEGDKDQWIALPILWWDERQHCDRVWNRPQRGCLVWRNILQRLTRWYLSIRVCWRHIWRGMEIGQEKREDDMHQLQDNNELDMEKWRQDVWEADLSTKRRSILS